LAGCNAATRAVTASSASTPPPGPSATLSSLARLGRKIFFDPSLSASGRLACSSCHDPAHAYAPANSSAIQMGGADLRSPGFRAVPSLEYTLNRTPVWSKEHPASRLEQLEETDSSPAGGFAWDGRFDSLHDQAAFPLLAPMEMANPGPAAVERKLAHAVYKAEFQQVCGQDVFATAGKAFDCARRALERFQLEDASFHPYTSKFDAWLDGKAQLTAQEQRGLRLFNDPRGGNCASCHLSQPGADHSHPLFTDYQFEAIGVPRNPEIPANRKPGYYDLGLCGPFRVDHVVNHVMDHVMDHVQEQSFCGMFKTPTLRNAATRGAFFHNGRFHNLKDALRWYVQRDLDAAAWYPKEKDGKVRVYDDLPAALRVNVDRVTPPFATHPGQRPVWTDADIEDVIAFLTTLNDGYQKPADRTK
jgi:cytochrome c peroxidase